MGQSGRYKNGLAMKGNGPEINEFWKIQTLEGKDPRTARLIRFLYLISPGLSWS